MTVTLDLAHFVTDEELLALAERNPGYQFERTREGRLRVTPTGGEAGRRSCEIIGQLYECPGPRWKCIGTQLT